MFLNLKSKKTRLPYESKDFLSERSNFDLADRYTGNWYTFLILNNIKFLISIFNLTVKFRGKRNLKKLHKKSHEVGWNLEISEDRLKELVFKQWNGRS